MVNCAERFLWINKNHSVQETRIKTFCDFDMDVWQTSVCWVKFSDWYLYRTLLSDRKFIVWSWIIRSIILEIGGSSEMALKFFESVSRPFLCKGLIFAALHLSGKETRLMERLEILAIGVQSTFTKYCNL